MGAEPDKLQDVLSGFPVDQDQVGADVAIPEVFPFAGEGVIAMTLGKRLIVSEGGDDRGQILDEGGSKAAPGLTFEITFEEGGSLNPSH
jgi:hypothetical protein